MKSRSKRVHNYVDYKEGSIKKYCLQTQQWQGIPAFAMTEKGRMFVCFYSGTKTEDLGNYCALIRSDDEGKTWSEPIAVSYFGEKSRAYDPCVWIDPKGRLWFYYSVTPCQKVYAVVCENPDASELTWCGERKIAPARRGNVCRRGTVVGNYV
ncbi:MAG: exo-alpha-sialidase [Clostridia bacterium]|nr:exo-alpha-sialidase [Clostridia bacterium]